MELNHSNAVARPAIQELNLDSHLFNPSDLMYINITKDRCLGGSSHDIKGKITKN
jgi:hypothetical protein